MHLVARLFGLALVAGLAGACAKTREGSPVDGQVVGPLYTNRYFGLSLNIPAGWTTAEFKPTFSTPGNTPRPAPKTPRDEHTHQLLMLSEKPLDSPQPANSSLLIMAEAAASVPGVKTAKDYLARASQLMIDAPIAYHPVSGIADTSVGGVASARLDFTARLASDKSARQSYLVCLRYGYVLSFILSATTEEELKRLEQVLQTARFD